MAKTRRRVFISSILLGLVLLLGPFQNCALHQSEGRKQFEKLVSRSIATVSACAPFLLQNQAAVIMDDPFTTSVRFANDGASCLISSEKYPQGFDLPTGLETAVCSLISDLAIKNITLPATPTAVTAATGLTLNASNIIYYIQSRYVVPPQTDPDPVEQPFFGVAALHPSDSELLRIIFFNQIDGLQCEFTVNKAEYVASAQLKEEAARRGSQLVKAIEPNF